MDLEKILKKTLSTALAGSVLFLNQGCSRIPETRKLENIIIHENYGKNPINLNLEQGNQALFDFPDKIPGAKKIDKYITPEARYCLVHIKQAHFKLNLSKKTLEKVEKVQSNIYEILSYLHNNLHIQEVYLEGITPSIEQVENNIAITSNQLDIVHKKYIENLKEFIRTCENKMNDETFISIMSQNKEDASDYKKYLKEVIKEKKQILEAEQEKYSEESEKNKLREKYWGVYRLASEGKITMKAAEDPTAQYIAEIELEKSQKNKKATRETMFAMFDNRERIVIEKITKQQAPLAIVVYGGGHVFGGEFSFGKHYKYGERFSLYDNIAYWNSKNPDKKISLIEITPESWY
jgi:hypothetical protein